MISIQVSWKLRQSRISEPGTYWFRNNITRWLFKTGNLSGELQVQCHVIIICHTQLRNAKVIGAFARQETQHEAHKSSVLQICSWIRWSQQSDVDSWGRQFLKLRCASNVNEKVWERYWHRFDKIEWTHILYTLKRYFRPLDLIWFTAAPSKPGGKFLCHIWRA